jgi:hypothetical protein
MKGQRTELILPRITQQYPINKVIFGFSVALQPTKSPADSSAITGGSFITSLSGSLFHKFLCLVLQEDARTETYPRETTYLRISCSDE